MASINERIHVCPKCNNLYKGVGALSRRDNKTEICSACGTREAMDDYAENVKNRGGKSL